MVERDVNPLAGRRLALSVRFKAGWAFHQLLVGMHRTQILERFDDKSDAFRAAFEKLKEVSAKLEGPDTSEPTAAAALLDTLDSEVNLLIAGLVRADNPISPSQFRRFFQQVRSFDERILIDIIRFYQRADQAVVWDKDRVDKADLVLSRLAEAVAGPDLQGDRARLHKILQALAVADDKPGTEEAGEITSLTATLQDLRSEVRWVKTFDDLHDSKLVQLYRALKHDMGRKVFHPELLPLVVEANNAFKLKIDELRRLEEERIISSYRKLLRGSEKTATIDPELDVALAGLQRQLDEFQTRSKKENVRLDELASLGKSLRDVSRRFEVRLREKEAAGTGDEPGGLFKTSRSRIEGTEALLPNLDALQPFWDELIAALVGLAPETDDADVSTHGSVLRYRLEAREVAACRALAGDFRSGPGEDRFILAAVAMRRRLCSTVEEVEGVLSETPGVTPESVLERAWQTSRMADAYLKHFTHLVEQAVFDGDLDSARSFQQLEARFMQEYSDLLNLFPRLTKQASVSAVDSPAESADLDSLATGSFGKQPGEDDAD